MHIKKLKLLASKEIKLKKYSGIIEFFYLRMRKPTKILLLLASVLMVLLLGTLNAQAQTFFCVRAGATGGNNGSDWNNAYTSLPSNLVRGAIYYIADGAYSGYTFNTSVSGTSWITIKKATVAVHGTNTGWNDSYGDGVATFGNLTFSTSYWEFDGQVGGGPGSWNSGHGFSIYATSGQLITLSGTVSHIAIKHLKLDSDRIAYLSSAIKGTTGACDNITISYCQISNIYGAPFHINNWTNSTIEYTYVYYNKSTAQMHSEGISSIGTNENITIRYNIWDRIEGTAVFAGVNRGTSINWQIYGNIFARSTTTVYYYWEADPSNNKNSMTNSKFFNNIVAGIPGTSQGGIVINSGSGNTFYNNIWYNNNANAFSINGTHDYQYSDSNIRTDGCSPPTYCDKDTEVISGESHGTANAGNPFVRYDVDPLLADFRLSAAISGYNTSALASGNTTDMLGNTRGADGVWDRGAVEFAEDGQGVSPPSGFRILTN